MEIFKKFENLAALFRFQETRYYLTDSGSTPMEAGRFYARSAPKVFQPEAP